MGNWYDSVEYLWTFDEKSKRARQNAAKTLKTGGTALGGLVSIAGAPEIGVPLGAGLGLLGEVVGSYKKGGMVNKTGIYKLHKGERVLSVKQKKALDKMKVKLPK